MKITPEIIEALKHAIDQYGNTSQFAKHIGVAHSTVLFWLSGHTTHISGKVWVSRVRRELHNFMNNTDQPAYGVREDLEQFHVSMSEQHSVPVMNFSAIISFDNTLESPVSFVKSHSAEKGNFSNSVTDSYFGLIIDKPDWVPFLPNGARLLVSGNDYAVDGDIVIGKLRNPAVLFLCRYSRQENQIRLTPLNPDLPMMEWLNSENAEKIFWMYPVQEILIDLQHNRWKNASLESK